MRHTIKTALGLVAIVLLMASVPAAAEGFKVGVFDPQRVSEETADGNRVQAELSALRDKMQAKISAKEQAITDLQKQLTQQALSLSVDKRTSLEMEIQRKMLDLNNSNDLASRELQLEVAGAQAKFNERLRVVVETVGREEGFDLILDQSVVAWAAESTGVTTAIIDSFDKMFPVAGAE